MHPTDPAWLEPLRRRFHEACRTRHIARRTERSYRGWIRRYLTFNGARDPASLGAREVERFLSHLAVERKVAASTQNQALAALLFLYRHALGQELPWMESIVRARESSFLPVVLFRAEVAALLEQISGTPRLVAALL